MESKGSHQYRKIVLTQGNTRLSELGGEKIAREHPHQGFSFLPISGDDLNDTGSRLIRQYGLKYRASRAANKRAIIVELQKIVAWSSL